MSAAPVSLTSLCIANFKRFQTIELSLQDHFLLITGPSGSGKTQLLWALLLFFRAYNIRAEMTEKCDLRLFGIGGEMGKLLCESLVGLTTFTSFVKQCSAEGAGQAMFLGTFSDKTQFKASLHSNGALELHNLPSHAHIFSEKIHFASVTSSPKIMSPDTTIDSDELLSNVNNTRLLYRELDHTSQERICEALKMLFGVKEITVSSSRPTTITLTDVCNAQQEILHHGAALQKVFTTLVFIFQLAKTKETHKFLLIDELEFHLHPTLLQAFVPCLKALAQEHGIKCAVTSIASEIIVAFPEHTLLLSDMT